jgi:uncharacterized protein Usg
MIFVAPPAAAGPCCWEEEPGFDPVSAAPDPSQYRLTTAEIVYRLPDEPEVLQTFIWQKFDRAPDFPELGKFLEFWRKNIDGPLYSVRVGQGSSRPRQFPHVAPASDGRH